MDQFDLSRNILAARSLECVVCFWGGRWQRLDSRHGCKAAVSAPAAEHVALSRVLHRGRRCLPARRAACCLERTPFRCGQFARRRPRSDSPRYRMEDRRDRPGNKGLRRAVLSDQRRPAHVCPRMRWTAGVAHRLPEQQSNRTRKVTGAANRPFWCKVIRCGSRRREILIFSTRKDEAIRPRDRVHDG